MTSPQQLPRPSLRAVQDDRTRSAPQPSFRPRVLLVDDDPAIRMICSIHLERAGMTVLEAADGRHALERARFECPDLVVTDVMMPELDGFGLAEALRRSKRTRDIPLIFLTGGSDEGGELRAQALGAVGYLSKPFDPHVFATLVARWLAPHTGAGDPAPA